MKSRFHFAYFAVLFALIFSTSAIAQTNPDRWNTDGNLGDTTKFLGTTDSEPVLFRTDNEERMRITANGRVGINVKKPQARLDVKGDVQFRNNVLLPGLPLALSTDQILFIDSTGQVRKGDPAGLSGMMYADKGCPAGTIAAPTWANGPNKIYSACPQVNVGIGTNAPDHKLDVRGYGYFSGGIKLGLPYTTSNQAYIEGYAILESQRPWINFVAKTNASGQENSVFVVTKEGNLFCTAARVRVKEDIPIPDFVFQADYNLRPLSEVKRFVQENQHLPEIPSECEIREEGLSLEEMQLKLLQKVEELTLYVIQLEETNTAQQEQIDALVKATKND